MTNLKEQEASAKRERQSSLKSIYDEMRTYLKEEESKRRSDYQDFIKSIRQEVAIIKEDAHRMLKWK